MERSYKMPDDDNNLEGFDNLDYCEKCGGRVGECEDPPPEVSIDENGDWDYEDPIGE